MPTSQPPPTKLTPGSGTSDPSSTVPRSADQDAQTTGSETYPPWISVTWTRVFVRIFGDTANNTWNPTRVRGIRLGKKLRHGCPGNTATDRIESNRNGTSIASNLRAKPWTDGRTCSHLGSGAEIRMGATVSQGRCAIRA